MNTFLLLSMLIGFSVLTYAVYNLHKKFSKYQSDERDRVKHLETENNNKKAEIQILQSKILELKIDLDRQFSKLEASLESQKIELSTQQSKEAENKIAQEEIKILQANIKQLKIDFEIAKGEIQRLQTTITELKIDFEMGKKEINKILKAKIRELKIDTDNKTRKEKIEILEDEIEDDLKLLIKSYNSNPYSLFEKAIKVRMTEDTINNLIDGILNNSIRFEEHSTGDYFIVSNHTGEFYLFLNPISIFNPQTLQIMNKSKLFICHGNFLSKTLSGENIPLIQPATLTRSSKNKRKWELIKSGEINLG